MCSKCLLGLCHFSLCLRVTGQSSDTWHFHVPTKTQNLSHTANPPASKPRRPRKGSSQAVADRIGWTNASSSPFSDGLLITQGPVAWDSNLHSTPYTDFSFSLLSLLFSLTLVSWCQLTNKLPHLSPCLQGTAQGSQTESGGVEV